MVGTRLLTPVVLSGGSGTRLWPLSRPENPKQFLALTAPETLFQLTLSRTGGLENCGDPVIVSNTSHADLVADQLGTSATLILEPSARNTAPAIALAAIELEEADSAMLVMPSDHVIADIASFHAAIESARAIVEEGWLVTFGIEPDAPETGYGYIALGDLIGPDANKVSSFTEKPDRARAEAMLAQGNYTWNAGIFLFSARAFLAALEAHQPEMLAAAREAMAKADRKGSVIRPDAAAFAKSPSDSIDYAVMERADKVACVPVSMGWSDVGSWDSLYGIADKDDADNAVTGAGRTLEASGNLIRSEGPRVTLVGVEDLIVIASADEVLILPRGRSQDVKRVVELNKATGPSS
jgi:mannose-1-phosphate guanylyltransferase/mannose-1-phosphate guanylyltransferase/mannose-6-phosphate isomerase